MFLLFFHDVFPPLIVICSILAIAVGGPLLGVIASVKLRRPCYTRQNIRSAVIAAVTLTVLSGLAFSYFAAPKPSFDLIWDFLRYLPTVPFGTGVYLISYVAFDSFDLAFLIGTACNFLAFLAISCFFTWRKRALK